MELKFLVLYPCHWYHIDMLTLKIQENLHLKMSSVMLSAEYFCKLFKPIFAYRQTVWTLIRLLLEKQSELGPHCLQKMTFKITSRWQEKKKKKKSCDGEKFMLIHDKDYFVLVLIYYTKLFKQMTKQTPIIVNGSLRVKGTWYTWLICCHFLFNFLHTRPLLERGLF